MSRSANYSFYFNVCIFSVMYQYQATSSHKYAQFYFSERSYSLLHFNIKHLTFINSFRSISVSDVSLLFYSYIISRIFIS